jgi:hypothetical protein
MTVTTTVTSNMMMAGKCRVVIWTTSADKHAAQAFIAQVSLPGASSSLGTVPTMGQHAHQGDKMVTTSASGHGDDGASNF